nr:uncharacterized protein LOC133614632 [Nerophis lumbriciformis]
MDYFVESGMDIAHMVIVSGATNTETEKEIIDNLSGYGDIKKAIIVYDSQNPYYKNLAVEFVDVAALEKLKPFLPYTTHTATGEVVVNLLLVEGAAATAEHPQYQHQSVDYLQVLRRLSRESGRPFEHVLKGAMDQISSHLGAVWGEDEGDDEDMEADDTEDGVASGDVLRVQAPSNPPTAPRISLSGHELTRPEVQRLVVEHIVRRDDVNTQLLSPLRLRTFSGKVPKPPHEADYEAWKTQMELLSADPSLAPLHITRRIIESLLSPAADLVKHLEPNALPATFLRILDSAYATVEDGEELFAKFLNTFQDHGERPSSYLQRLQLTISGVIKRGGIPAGDTDKHLLKQFCRGCWDNTVINKLQLEQKKDQPPSFADLLFMLRTEEDRQYTKDALMKRHIPSVKHRVNLQTQSATRCSCGHSSNASAIDELRKQMVKLQEQMSALLSRKTQNTDRTDHKQNKQKPRNSNAPKPWFCFKCGQDGHISPNCPNNPNPALVENKRRQVKLKQQSGESRKPLNCMQLPRRDKWEQSIDRCPHSRHSTFQASIPKGLVGTRSTGVIKIRGANYHCLFDTGSQVTTVSHSFYNTYLADHEVKPLNNLLEVEGANGQSVPYIGYIELGITFPAEFVGEEMDINTLALVVPDLRSSQPPVLIGTNTLDTVYDLHSHKRPEFHPVPFGYRAVLKILEIRHKLATDDHQGVLRMQSTEALTIPAGQTVVLDAFAVCPFLQGEKEVVIQHPASFTLPGGLIIQSCLVDLPSVQPARLPVVATNKSGHDIVIPVRGRIAEISAIQSVFHKEQSVEPSQLTYNFGDSPLSPEWKLRVTAMLNSVPEVFAKHDLDFGRTDKVKHEINLSDPATFKQRPRPLNPQDVDAVRKHLQELLESGVIRESSSPFASPIVVVRKKNGTVRLCIDYRKLNAQTIKDAYALPKLEDTFSALSGSVWFSVLDLKSGYYQIEMEERDKAKTAFVCPLGFYEFNRMPQGITNAPSTFQRLMEHCVGDLNLKQALVFIDDLIVFAPTLEEHEQRLQNVLQRLKEYGLKLSVEKCMFFQTSVHYLGHVVSSNGVETDPSKISALMTWPVPKNLKELRSFLGFAGYYRRFVEGYSSIARLLNELTAGYPPSQKKTKQAVKSQHYLNPKENFGGRSTPACQDSFEAIIQKLTTAPVLAFADPSKPYVLHTDACSTGLGAVLYQEHDGRKRAVAFASRGVSRSEARYSAHKLEFLALKWAVTEKFSDYLYGSTFTVVTDSNPLTYLLTSAKLDATSYRWLSSLSTYTFKIIYRAGKLNADADGLSRQPHVEHPEDNSSKKKRERILRFAQHHLDDPSCISIDEHLVQAVCDRHLVYSSPDKLQVAALVQALSISVDGLPDSFVDDQQFSFPVTSFLSVTEIADKQRADPVIQHVVAQLEHGFSPPPSLREQLPDLPLLLRELPRLEIFNNVLVRKRNINGEPSYQLVLPEECRTEVLYQLHDQMGHLGTERTIDLIRARFYWPRMSIDITNKVKTCERCVRRKALPERAAPLVNIQTARPLELVCMDFLSIEPDRSSTKNVLVITDHFTKYAVAVPTSNQKATTVAKALWDNFLVHYGIPERLHSDQGPDFESHTIKELCQIMGIHKIRTTPYHPRGNPVERFNRTLLNMLGTLQDQDKTHWRDFVKPLVHAYNCTRNDVTGYSPYELMFGRQPRLPIDLVFGLPVSGNPQTSHSQYVEKLKSHLEDSYRIATKNAEKVMGRNKSRFDKRVTPSELSVGDRVLVRNVKLRGKHKIADRWESDVYIVKERAGTLPVYTVKPEGKVRPVRTLHRDLLLPCGYLSTTPKADLPKQPTTSARVIPPVDPAILELSEPEYYPPDVYLSNLPETCSAPAKFTSVIDLPVPIPSVVPVAVPVSLPGQPSQRATEGDPVGVVHSVEMDQETPADPGQVFELQDTELVPEVDGDALQQPEDSTYSTSGSPQAASTLSEPKSPTGTETFSPESVSLAPRPSRIRKPPSRLQYSKLGHPVLRSIQTLFQGLSNVFDSTLQVEESGSTITPQEQIVCRQPPPCTRPYMSIEGEPVTHI